MKMPNHIPDNLLAPCGIDCMLCHHHCDADAPCQGCREGKGTSNHCRTCEIMFCAREKGHFFCADCPDFPCEKVTTFNDFYIERYGHQFLPNALLMKERGKDEMIARLLQNWKCPECGGIICIHTNKCSQCGADMLPLDERLKARNDRIIAAVIEKANRECPGALALIGLGGSFRTGDIHPKSDLDLCIVINDESGYALCQSFIAGGVGHDIYCSTWDDIQGMSEWNSPYVSKLADAEIVYAASDDAQARFDALREKCLAAMHESTMEQRLEKARGFIDTAKGIYANVMLFETMGKCRYAAAWEMYFLEQALYMLNGEYVRRGVKRMPGEMRSLKLQPKGFMEAHEAVYTAETLPALREAATRLMLSMASFADSLAEKSAPEAGDLNGLYEEAYSNWKNKMAAAENAGDRYLAFMTCASCQNYYEELAAEHGTPVYNPMDGYDPEDLTRARRRFDEYLDAFGADCVSRGAKLREYPDIDSFIKEYLE